jgi:hypothetical protein
MFNILEKCFEISKHKHTKICQFVHKIFFYVCDFVSFDNIDCQFSSAKHIR